MRREREKQTIHSIDGLVSSQMTVKMENILNKVMMMMIYFIAEKLHSDER